MSMTKNFDIDCVIEFEVGFSIVEYWFLRGTNYTARTELAATAQENGVYPPWSIGVWLAHLLSN